MIPLKDCKPGYLYRLRARNILYGVFNGDGGFIGLRDKFDALRLDVEMHREASVHFGTVTPLEEIGQCPVSSLSHRLPGTYCGECERLLMQHGEPGSIHYTHIDDGSPKCASAWPTVHQNQELFDWLKGQEQKLRGKDNA